MLCGGCTLCCRLLDVPWMGSPAGDICRECVAGEGCGLWPDLPAKCAEYACAYRQSPNASELLRPDRSRVIFEMHANTFFLGVVAADFVMTEVVERQAAVFVRQGFSVLFHTRPQVSVMLAPGHTQAQLKRLVGDLLQDRARVEALRVAG